MNVIFLCLVTWKSSGGLNQTQSLLTQGYLGRLRMIIFSFRPTQPLEQKCVVILMFDFLKMFFKRKLMSLLIVFNFQGNSVKESRALFSFLPFFKLFIWDESWLAWGQMKNTSSERCVFFRNNTFYDLFVFSLKNTCVESQFSPIMLTL